MHARHYSPLIGRFLQPDPDASEANLYAYAANSPVTEMDPSGTCFIILCVALGAAVLGGLGATLGAATFAVGLQPWDPSGGSRPKDLGEAALRGFVDAGSLAIGPGPGYSTAALRAAARSKLMPRSIYWLSGHAQKQMATRGVTKAMVSTVVRRGAAYWDPLNRSVTYVLEKGMGVRR